MTESKDFFTAYDHLPAIIQPEIRDKIVKACGWKSVKTFYDKKKHPERIKPLEAREIIRVFSEHGYSVSLNTAAA